MKTLRKKLKVQKVFFTARANANVEDCIRECIAFAATNDVKCVLEHNSVEIEISIDALVSKAYEEWNQKLSTFPKKK